MSKKLKPKKPKTSKKLNQKTPRGAFINPFQRAKNTQWLEELKKQVTIEMQDNEEVFTKPETDNVMKFQEGIQDFFENFEITINKVGISPTEQKNITPIFIINKVRKGLLKQGYVLQEEHNE